MDSSSFTENVLEWKWTDESTDALISNFHFASVKCGQRLVHFNHCYWLLGLSRLLIGGLPRTETGHPPINHIGGPLGEPGFSIFWQCCQLKKNPGHPGGTLGGPHKFWVVRHTNIKKWYAYFDNHTSNMAASSGTIGHGLWRKKYLGCSRTSIW